MKNNLEFKTENGKLIVCLIGHIDSNNAVEVEQKIMENMDANPDVPVILDCTKLEYISSAGLRVVLKVSKRCAETEIINVSSEVYEIFDMTGFTQMLNVKKAFKTISVKGCEVIGQGANGKVYRIDPETIVKVFTDEDALQDIERERELARTAFVLGIPTAISYDVVKIEGGGYGSVYELLKASNFAGLIINKEKSLDEVVKMSIDLLKLIHSKEVDPNSMPSMKERALDWVNFLKDYLPADQHKKLESLVSSVPEDNHMLHGDYHLRNIMYQDGEALLIDMDTICHGNPIFELAFIFNAYRGFSDVGHEHAASFMGLPYETMVEIWRKSLSLYLGTEDKARLDDVEKKAMVIGYARILRREIRRNGLDSEDGKKVVAKAKQFLADLIPAVDTLTF